MKNDWVTDLLIYLPKCYNFDKHALISKDTGNAHTKDL